MHSKTCTVRAAPGAQAGTWYGVDDAEGDGASAAGAVDPARPSSPSPAAAASLSAPPSVVVRADATVDGCASAASGSSGVELPQMSDVNAGMGGAVKICASAASRACQEHGTIPPAHQVTINVLCRLRNRCILPAAVQ